MFVTNVARKHGLGFMGHTGSNYTERWTTYQPQIFLPGERVLISASFSYQGSDWRSGLGSEAWKSRLRSDDDLRPWRVRCAQCAASCLGGTRRSRLRLVRRGNSAQVSLYVWGTAEWRAS